MVAVLGPPAPQAWQPSDQGLLVANGDPWLAVNSSVLTAGTVYLAKLPVRSPALISNLWLAMAIAGAGASTGSFAGLYSPAGVLLSESADIGALLTGGTGGIECPLAAAQQIQGGPESAWPWLAVLVNLATTQPAIARANGSSAVPNLGLAPASYRFAIPSGGTGLLALPASFTPANNAYAAGINIWAAAS